MAVEAVKEVQTSVGLVSSFCDTIWITIMRISHVLIPVGNGYLMVFVFSTPFRSIYHARTFIPR